MKNKRDFDYQATVLANVEEALDNYMNLFKDKEYKIHLSNGKDIMLNINDEDFLKVIGFDYNKLCDTNFIASFYNQNINDILPIKLLTDIIHSENYTRVVNKKCGNPIDFNNMIFCSKAFNLISEIKLDHCSALEYDGIESNLAITKFFVDAKELQMSFVLFKVDGDSNAKLVNVAFRTKQNKKVISSPNYISTLKGLVQIKETLFVSKLEDKKLVK